MTEATNVVTTGVEAAEAVKTVTMDIPKGKNGLIISLSAATIVGVVMLGSWAVKKVKGKKNDPKVELVPEPNDIQVEE